MDRRVVFLAALIPALLLTWRFDFLCDDAYITFVYARNLAEGNGLVYNPGQWVEGYSEFAWALLLAVGQLVGVGPEFLSRAVSVMALMLLLWVASGWLHKRHAGSSALSASLFLGCLPPLAVWSTGGLATVPFAAAVTALFVLAWREEPVAWWKLALVGGLAALLRADGAYWVALVLAPCILCGGEGRKAALLGAVGAAAIFFVHMGWRYQTYGDWLPNTARVKVGLSGYAAERGASYVGHLLLSVPGMIVALFAGLVALRDKRGLAAWILILGTMLYSVLVGGDFMAFGRFLVPLVAALAFVLAFALDRIRDKVGDGGAYGLGAAAALLSVLVAFDVNLIPTATRASWSVRHNGGDVSRERSEVEQWKRMAGQAEEWKKLGEGLALVSQPGDSLVYGAVGAIGWTSRLKLYDMNGLITPSVSALPAQTDPPRSPGHDKTVGPSFFADVGPTYLMAAWVPTADRGWRAAAGQHRMLRPWLDRGLLEKVDLPEGQHPFPGHYLLVVRG